MTLIILAPAAGSLPPNMAKPFPELEKRRSGRVPYLQFHGTCYVFATIPETCCWLNGGTIRKGCNGPHQPAGNVVQSAELFVIIALSNVCEDTILLGLKRERRVPYCYVFCQKKYLNTLKNLYFAVSQKENARSSNGRTSDFGSDYVGSNPARATTKPLPRSGRVFFRWGLKTCFQDEKEKTSFCEAKTFCWALTAFRISKTNPARANQLSPDSVVLVFWFIYFIGKPTLWALSIKRRSNNKGQYAKNRSGKITLSPFQPAWPPMHWTISEVKPT